MIVLLLLLILSVLLFGAGAVKGFLGSVGIAILSVIIIALGVFVFKTYPVAVLSLTAVAAAILIWALLYKEKPLSEAKIEEYVEKQKASDAALADSLGVELRVDGNYHKKIDKNTKEHIDEVKALCDAALSDDNTVPEPRPFHLMSIRSRNKMDYQQEVFYSEQYLEKVEQFYASHAKESSTDVRDTKSHQAILNRLPKAKELLLNESS